jgi:hypothetical protein
MSLMSGALRTHEHASEAKTHGVRGDARALPHREAGLKPQDTCRHQSPSLPSGWSSGMGHMATSEPSRIGRRVWSRGTLDDTIALPCRVVGQVARGDARVLPHQEASLDPQDT